MHSIMAFMIYMINTFQFKKIKKSNTRNLRNLWISNGLKKSSNTKERLYKRFLKNPTEVNEKKIQIIPK